MKFKVTNIDALAEAYPHLVESVTVRKADRKKIGFALKAGLELPGVEIPDSQEQTKFQKSANA